MSEHRLPTTVAPHNYQIHLAPDLDAATFEGTVSIAAMPNYHKLSQMSAFVLKLKFVNLEILPFL